MENAAEALKMAFAIILLVLALSVSMFLFSKARSTAQVLLQRSDPTEYYDYINYTKADLSGNRVVGFETIIPTLYKYDKENYEIAFKEGKLNTNGSVEITKDLPVYYSTITKEDICYFDILKEKQRGEYWTGSKDEIKKHLNALFDGSKYYLPQYGDNTNYIDYSNSTYNQLIIYKNKNKKFVELIGKEQTTEDKEDEITGIKGNKTITKRIITYVKIN